MPGVRVSGVNFYFESRGRGDPMILIRGLGSNADHWYAQVPAFEQTFRVITFDNRGIARSGGGGAEITTALMAADTVALMDALSVEKAHLLGVSMGGMIAQEVALRHPRRVVSLTLVATHCGGTVRIAASPEIEKRMAEMVGGGNGVAGKKAVEAMFAPRTLAEHPEVVEKFEAVSARRPAGPSILGRQWQAVRGHDTSRRLHRVAVPTLVLTGDADRIVPPENAGVLAALIPGARLRRVAGGGHQVLVERPRACNAAVLDFVAGLSP